MSHPDLASNYMPPSTKFMGDNFTGEPIQDATPPPLLRGKEYRLPPHLIPELYALVNVKQQRENGRPYLTSDYTHDITISCSPDAKRIIALRLFSPGFKLSEVPVWRRTKIGELAQIPLPLFRGWNDALKEHRNIATGIILSLTLDYQRAREREEAFGIEYVEDRHFLGRTMHGKILLREKKRKEVQENSSRKPKKNAERQLLKAIGTEYGLFEKDLQKIIQTLKHLPHRHPLYWMSKNFSKLTRVSTATFSGQFNFIHRGLNTFKTTMKGTVRAISDVARINGITLTPEQIVDIFEESSDIARILSNMNIDLFSGIDSKLAKNMLSIVRGTFNPAYFKLIPIEKGSEKMKLVFSEAGNALIAAEKKKFQEEVEARPEITVTSRCPARRDGVAREDDITLNLYRRIVQRARAHVIGKAA